MSSTSIACRDLIELVTDYLEDTLTPAQRDAVQTHLAGCGNCAEYLQQMRELIDLSPQLLHHRPDLDALPVGMMDGLLQAFRQRRPHT